MPNPAATTLVQNYLAKLTPGTTPYNNEVTVLNALKAIPSPPAGSLDLGNGTSQAIIVGNQTGTENFVTARVNYALSSKDSIFGRMIYDHATLSEPFAANNLDQYPQTASTTTSSTPWVGRAISPAASSARHSSTSPAPCRTAKRQTAFPPSTATRPTAMTASTACHR